MRGMTFSKLVLLPAAMTASVPAIADDAANRADAQCLSYFAMVLGGGGASEESEVRYASGVAYFVGRIEARSPDQALASLVVPRIAELEQENNGIGNRCEGELEAVEDRLIALSNAIGE